MENDVPPGVPPIHTAPPPVITPPPPVRPASRGGRGWMVVSLILAVLLILVFVGQFVRASWSITTATGGQSGRLLQEVVAENNGSDNKIAIIDIDGIITSMEVGHRGRNMVELIGDQLKMAGRDHAVRAVLLKVDSPGGEVMASDDISRAISEFQDKYQKPVVVSMGSLAASGGYYVSAPCQWIVANELTMTGSIGVIMSTFNYRGLLDKIGVYPQVFKSGRFKDMLRGSKKLDEIDPEEERMIKNMIQETYGKFVSVVETGRGHANKENNGSGRSLAPNWKDFADGRILTGKQAFDLGFVDELGTFESAVKRTKKLARIPDANLIRYQEPFSFANMFSLFGESRATGVKVELPFELPKLQAGRLYFLAPTVLH